MKEIIKYNKSQNAGNLHSGNYSMEEIIKDSKSENAGNDRIH